MTEAEWLSSTDPQPMLEFLSERASERKLRLFGVACCRQQWDAITDGRLRQAVESAADWIETPPADETRAKAEALVIDAYEREMEEDDESGFCGAVLGLLSRRAYTAGSAASAAYSAVYLALGASENSFDGLDRELAAEQTDLVRDVFRNPFHPVTLDPDWLTSTVAALAAGIYADRAFDRLPILADALQDAGCEHPDILAHCRGDGPHVRGCWVVDLLLQKG